MAFRLTKDETRRLDEFQSFVADVRDRLQGEFDDRSEAWQDDKGTEAQTLIDAWSELADAADAVPTEW